MTHCRLSVAAAVFACATTLACAGPAPENPVPEPVVVPLPAPDLGGPVRGGPKGKLARCDIHLALDGAVDVYRKPDEGLHTRVPAHVYTSAHIIDSRDGWFKLDRIHIELSEEKEPVLPEGAQRGWVKGEDLYAAVEGAGAKSAILFANPGIDAEVIDTFPAESRLEPTGCDGKWIEGKIQGKRGWAHPEQLCGNPFTTCAGFDPELERRFGK